MWWRWQSTSKVASKEKSHMLRVYSLSVRRRVRLGELPGLLPTISHTKLRANPCCKGHRQKHSH